jgi:hypothetical protein
MGSASTHRDDHQRVWSGGLDRDPGKPVLVDFSKDTNARPRGRP